MPLFTNSLINETSPYLLQHAHNPVNWLPWGPEAWEKARLEDKLVIISIGYSACHWCHVMEHQSFEDESVAALMNEHFISIKVDREERPDVDQVYMDAVQLISGHGGWPLNAIALPDGRPVHAGTYFPKEHWKELLAYLSDYYKNQREEAIQRAIDITNGIKGNDNIEPKTANEFTVDYRTAIFKKLEAAVDFEKGGRRGAPKFPMPVNYRYLLQNSFYTKSEKALKAVTVTLDNMMNGGIYDQVGGGFARYSVDAEWEIPHFEKMLYDNAQLVSLYSEAYRVTHNLRYKKVVDETLAFIERELSDTSGGFYSALDADSEGEEGKFYVWSYNDLKKLLGNEFPEFCKTFNVSEGGNFEDYNHLTRNPNYNADEARIANWKTLLLQERSKRVRPRLDDKVLTSWNALMLMGYIDAYNSFGDKNYLNRALQAGNFLKNQMLQPDNSLVRNYKNGKTTISGFLDDYSFTCEAFIALYQATLNNEWIELANAMAEYVIQHFYNLATSMFFYTSVNDAPLIARKTETSDNVIPASNSSMAKALFKLGLLFDKEDYIQKAKKALNNVSDNVLAHPSFYANWATLMDWFIDEPYEVAVTGAGAADICTLLNKHFMPNALVFGANGESKLPLLQGKFKPAETLIYVCHNKTCQAPVNSVERAMGQILK
ncbi:MAG TPA: thioredoxin domain-containing protein [Chitinophagales bacterium]|nr:thioredoxin domain-containing protein [Chitinophagales bacterium]